jgi:uncharacterized protein (TIGR03086 family)
MTDLSAACRRTADVVANVPDGMLDSATPCEHMRVHHLLAHIGGLASAFTAAARKDFGRWTDTPPDDAAALDDDWRSAYPQRLTALSDAWREADAWTGMTRAGGIDLPGEVAGLVALTEVVLHGWDVAAASGQTYECDATTAQVCLDHLLQFDPAGTEGMFGPAVPVPEDAPVLDRIVALSGRDPQWGSR